MKQENFEKNMQFLTHKKKVDSMDKRMELGAKLERYKSYVIWMVSIVTLFLCVGNIQGEIFWDGHEDGKILVVKLNEGCSYMLDEKGERNEICLSITFPNIEEARKFEENLSECMGNGINPVHSRFQGKTAEIVINQEAEYNCTVNVEKDDNIIQIQFVPKESSSETYSGKINQVVQDLDALISNTVRSNIQYATLNEKDTIEYLDKNISKLKVENELKMAKNITPTVLMSEPPTIYAQGNQDVTGTQSLSVGNVGTIEKKIEIREAKPLMEQPTPPQEDTRGEENKKEEEEKPQETTEEQPPTAEEQAVPEPPKPREAVPELAVDATAELTKELRELEEAGKSETVSKEAKPGAPETKLEEIPETKIIPSPQGLDTIIDFECEKMPLSKVVSLLAYKAGINVIAGTALKGEVTMSLKKVTLRKAIETCLKIHDLGLIQEDNIYRIVPYDEALESDRSTVVVKLENAKASEIKRVLEDIKKGTRIERYITVSANDTTNVVIVSGPEEHIQGLGQMARELDIAKPVIPTVTATIRLNYSDAEEMAKSIQKILTPRVGLVSADVRARHIIVTDYPVVVEQVKEVVKNLDIPVKQVLIDTMVVDASLDDEAQTGIDWLLRSVRHQSWRDFVMYGPEGKKIGNLQQLDLEGSTLLGDTIGKMTFSILSNEIDWKGVIQAEIRNQNGHLISNPVVATIENKPATITISQEIPYIDLSQTAMGGAMTNTRFKQVGTVLEVTPKVTHDNHVIVDIKGKESTIVGEFNGVPIEDLRQVTSTLHINSGQTIFVGGLRKRNDTSAIKKIPVIGDIPVVGMLFKNNKRNARINELLIFLTCSVVDQELPGLNPEQQKAYDEAKQAPMNADVQKYLWHDLRKPKEAGEAPYKLRRVEKECKKEEQCKDKGK